MVLLLLIGLFFLGVCVIALVRVATMHRVRTAERLADIEDYGFGAVPAALALPTRPASNGIADFVGRIGESFARRVGSVSEDRLRAELMAAGMYTTAPRTLLGYRVLAAILLPAFVLVLLGASAVPILLAIVLVPVGWLLPLVLVRRQARLRLEKIDRRIPDLIDLLVVTIEGGLGFSASLRLVSDQLQGPLSDELRLTLQEQTMGLGLDEALANFVRRCDTRVVRSFVRSMAQGERLGISMGQIMRNMAVDARQRRRKGAEERAQKAPVKMLFPLVFLIFPSILIVLLVPAVITLVHGLG
jgi:tight adherence protein C